MGSIWRRRWLLLSFYRRELSSRYSGTLAGGLWALGQPVLMLAIYGFVFRKVFKIDFTELGEHSFTAFVACALWPWMAFQESLQRGTQAIVANAGLVRKISFPHELLVFASVAATFTVHLFGFVAVLAALALFGEPFHWLGLPVVAIAWLVLLALAVGLTLLSAAVQVFLRDIDHLLGPVLMIMFYVTPILYPLSQVPESMRGVLALNPLVHILEPLRAALLHGNNAGIAVLLGWLALALLLLYAARRLFGRLAGSFEDFL